MGIATTFVLICTNFVLSLLKKVIPNQVRLPCYIVIIAGFVTFVQMMVEVYIPPLYESLGLFLPLIAVNCIVLGRAEAFASKNNPALSALDGLGMGVGFTLALFLMGTVREILGTGTIFSGTDYTVEIPFLYETPMALFIYPAGGFFTFAILIAILNKMLKRQPREIGCESCPSRKTCSRSSCKNSPENSQAIVGDK
jgi:electron transport complex protein RnfE